MASKYDLSTYLRESRIDHVRAARNLRDILESELRQYSPKDAASLMKFLSQILSQLIDSSDVSERVAGIAIIDQLIDMPIDKTRLSGFLRMVLPSSDPLLVSCATQAIGHLARSTGSLIVDFVEFEARAAFTWLRQPPDKASAQPLGEPHWRECGVKVLRALAANAPNMLYLYMPALVEVVFPAMCDPRPEMRAQATLMLRAFMQVLRQRQDHQRRQEEQLLMHLQQFGTPGRSDAIMLLTLGGVAAAIPAGTGDQGMALRRSLQQIAQWHFRLYDQAVSVLPPARPLGKEKPHVITGALNTLAELVRSPACEDFLLLPLSASTPPPATAISLGEALASLGWGPEFPGPGAEGGPQAAGRGAERDPGNERPFEVLCALALDLLHSSTQQPIRLAALELVALLAQHTPGRFAPVWLGPAMAQVTAMLHARKDGPERVAALRTLGVLALALGPGAISGALLQPALLWVREVLAAGKKRHGPALWQEALTCVARLAEGLPGLMEAEVPAMLDKLFAEPPSEPLVEARLHGPGIAFPAQPCLA
ncbi:putative protein kinase [Paratrimastix pyriformis]|uniref:Uncharacterized protein n=1 Tax=Paratrimastix pyriformis TaxID=342808 RepID=A0ABQ8UUC1_9EUKA|nr:putative protein kinase [Paratrimastix pyriformis]